jgi:hypothetical protein
MTCEYFEGIIVFWNRIAAVIAGGMDIKRDPAQISGGKQGFASILKN